jgi:hypothetical protein
MQEVILAKSATASNVRAACTWIGLLTSWEGLSRSIIRHLRLRNRLEDLVEAGFGALADLARDYQKNTDGVCRRFTHVWWKSSSARATNMRDHIYRVLGLIEPEPDDSLAIVSDYRKSDMEVFAVAVSLCLQRDNNSNVLSLAGIGVPNESRPPFTLPSWAPHFAIEEMPRLLALEVQLVRPDPLHCCAGVLLWNMSLLTQNFGFERQSLIVQGTIVDTVCELTEKFLDRRYLADTDRDICAWIRKAPTFAHKSSVVEISLLALWERWARTMSHLYLAISKTTIGRITQTCASYYDYDSFLKFHEQPQSPRPRLPRRASEDSGRSRVLGYGEGSH